MPQSLPTNPYEKFQSQAVRAIVKDFKEKPEGRYLLVIPTAGGKTYTAIRAIGSLYAEQVLKAGDRVAWIAHRAELLIQAREELARYNASSPPLQLEENVHIVFSMVSSAKGPVDHPATKFVVFDEAHHTAAPTYYDAAFAQQKAGILGLTATPSRHDGKPLDFERESFSIGFPDLIKCGALLYPTIVPVPGITCEEVRNLFSETDLEHLNAPERDARLIDALIRGASKYTKVIVFVGTRRHALALHQRMLATKLSELYDGAINWVFGGPADNSQQLPREEFFQKEKERKRSILINVDVLTEGYNDRTVNTVVMAAPVTSKLYCLQVVGRAVRLDPANPGKEAYVLEVADNLPNIRYRIDNRWLFSDISDALEPAVEDQEYSDQATFEAAWRQLRDKWTVTTQEGEFGAFDSNARYSALLFKQYASDGSYQHLAIPITPTNRMQVINAFNYLSERLPKLVHTPAARVRGYGPLPGTPGFNEPSFDRFFEAMQNQQKVIAGLPAGEFIKVGYPWLRFVNFRFWQTQITDDLLTFIKPCANFQELHDQLASRSFAPDSFVIRLPLPVGGTVGRIVTADVVIALDVMLAELREAAKISNYEQCEAVLQAMSRAPVPLETRLHTALHHIVRDNYEWKKKIA